MRRAVVLALAIAAVPGGARAEEEADADGDEEERERPALGIAPGTLQLSEAPIEHVTDGFKLTFHGFLRVPMRVGFGDGELHAPPQVPDGAYTDWQYINQQSGPWTELRFSYGNGRVAANVHIAAFDVSDASFTNPQAQLGINESFVTLRFPDLFGAGSGLVWNVGAFSNRYGAAGRYSAGKYETYLFGATHVAGETVSVFYDVSDGVTLLAEHGIGAKLQPTPTVPGLPASDLFPYPGEDGQGSTLVHHAHVGASFDRMLTVAAHYLTAWTDDAGDAGEFDGRLTSVGVEAEIVDSRWGDGYVGVARLTASTPQRVAGALEVLHTVAGWSVCDVYFPGAACDGHVDTLLFQHTFSLSKYLWHPRPFWGQAADLQVSVFGMYNKISTGTSKLKLGGEVYYTPRHWLGAGVRYDVVQPDLDDSTKSFQVFNPRVVLRSRYAGHEEIILQYSHYLHGDDVQTAYPHLGLPPDDGVFQIIATMWW